MQAVFDTDSVKGFDKADYGLLSVRVDSWGFLAFVNLDPCAAPQAEQFGDLPERFSSYRLDEWKVMRTKNYEVEANYKLISENFMEYYHLPWVHPELVKVSRMEDHYRWQGPGMYTGMCTTPVSRNTEAGGWKGLPPIGALGEHDAESGRFVWLFPNTAVIKPAEQTPLTALKFAEIFLDLGFPPGVYNVVPGFGPDAGKALSEHPGIGSITFTGSVETERSILRAVAEHVKPVVLELGGKSPQIIFADTDLDLAAGEISKGIYSNTGQYCDAGSRLVVEEGIREPLLEKIIQHSRQIKLGKGVDNPDMGPLVSAEHLERVLGYLDTGQEEGANMLIGGRAEEFDRGYFVSPTVFDGVESEMRIAREEIFGPVLSVLPFSDDDEAARIANDSSYGLAAGIFTRDIDRAMRFASEVEAGYVMINEYHTGGVGSPFGGYKQSGIGREKGLVALENYTQIKNVVLRIR